MRGKLYDDLPFDGKSACGDSGGRCEKISIAKTGSAFEHLSCFPDRINTEFIQTLDQHTIKMRVWERGSGETLSCGTGACAAAVAAMLSGCVSEGETAVELRGGRLLLHGTGRKIRSF